MIIDHVRNGLSSFPKRLPAYLFYDELGSQLYEQITSLPEYYLTRVEHSILQANADRIVRQARGLGSRLTIVELGAGSATKTEVLLQAATARRRECLYVPVDISATALDQAARRLTGAMPGLTVCPLLATHEQAFDAIRRLAPPVLGVFIGSSIGNYEDAEALELLAGLSRSLDPNSWLLLGTDLRKNPACMLPAHDDAAAVTAAFNKNVLTRINRELGGQFELSRFRHAARWNEDASRVEMHLVSLEEHEVEIRALSMRVHFGAGETIHTESSVKYDEERVHRLLARSGFEAPTTYVDAERLFAVHLAHTSLGERRSERRAPDFVQVVSSRLGLKAQHPPHRIAW